MRLIDADRLSEVLNDLVAETFDECEEHTIRGCLHIVQQMPTIDAVPVVRCKDCRAMNEDTIFGQMWCVRTTGAQEVKKDDFCSYGERREENAAD